MLSFSGSLKVFVALEACDMNRAASKKQFPISWPDAVGPGNARRRTPKPEKKCLPPPENGGKSPKMNPMEKQFSLNRAASKKQFPISKNRVRIVMVVCIGMFGLAAPMIATVGVSPADQVQNVVKLRYKLRYQENHSVAAMKILFTGFSVYTPGQSDVYYMEANLYSMWIQYADQGCASWPPQNHGPNHPGEAGLWVSIPDYMQKGLVGIRQTNAQTLRMFPRISTGIDNISGLTKIETISQTNVTGLDIELEFSRGETFSNGLSGWGSRIDPTNATECLADLIGGVVYRQWNLTGRMGGAVFGWQYAVPEQSGCYLAPWRMLDLVTEFFSQPGLVRVYVWDVELQQEGDPVWRPIKKWVMNYRASPDPNHGYGCRLAADRGKIVMEFSNDGQDNYFQLHDVFEMPADLSFAQQGSLTVRGSVGTRYQVQYTENLPATNWLALMQRVLLETPQTLAVPIDKSGRQRFFRTAVVGTTNLLVWIPPGSFTMGSPVTEPGRAGNETEHPVTVSEGFWMSQYEVTQGEYVALMSTNPSTYQKGLACPVESMRWEDATNYCFHLTQQEAAAGRLPTGYIYRLPTEAEWEYACRARTTGPFSFGSKMDGTLANLNGQHPYPPVAGGDSNGVARSTPVTVGAYGANPFGLFDMHGNVFEWCLDWYGDYPAGSVTNPRGPTTGTAHIFRGGAWGSDCAWGRSAARWAQPVDFFSSEIGFRVVLGKS